MINQCYLFRPECHFGGVERPREYGAGHFLQDNTFRPHYLEPQSERKVRHQVVRVTPIWSLSSVRLVEISRMDIGPCPEYSFISRTGSTVPFHRVYPFLSFPTIVYSWSPLLPSPFSILSFSALPASFPVAAWVLSDTKVGYRT